MATKKEVLEQALRGEGCLGRAPDDCPVFVLVGKDIIADDCVEHWIALARIQGTPSDKLLDAGQVAEEMRQYKNRKVPD